MSRVLIVDDEESSRLSLGRYLHVAGHDAFFARDGNLAIEFLRKESADLVVTDLAMPGLNGLRLIREIRGIGDSIPIVAVSGKASEQLQLAEDYGADATLFKPVDPRLLLETVERLVRGHARTLKKMWA